MVVEQALERQVMKITPPVSDNTGPKPLRSLDIQVPALIGRYQLGRRIGSGTCGVVHLAIDRALRREVAIKVSPVGDMELSTGRVPGAQRAYETELIAAGRLEHRNIVTVYDAGQIGDLNYLVMEVVRGRTLKAYGKGRERLPASQALSIIIDCCLALDYSHSKGILHRDIKPANIMVAKDGCVKLLDFGIAVGLSGEGALARQGPTLGTPNYMSPEQILGRELSPASDFYSLATILYEMLSGRQLFKASTVKDLFRTVIKIPAEPLSQARPDLPVGLSSVLSLCLEKRPSNRFQTGADLARELSPYVAPLRALEAQWPLSPGMIELARLQAGFENLSTMQVRRLLEGLPQHRYRRGEQVQLQVADEGTVLVILEGAVRVSGPADDTRVLGIGDVLDAGRAPAWRIPTIDSREALSAVTVRVIDKAQVASLPRELRKHCNRQFLEREAIRQAQRYDAVSLKL